MRVARVTFRHEHKLGAAEARNIFIDGPSTAQSTDLPIPEKPGCEVHLIGDWILVIEVWKDKAHPRASFVTPREGVDEMRPTEAQAIEMLKAME